MKGPISYAINWPDRVAKATTPIDWSKSQQWDFAPVDHARFPAIQLAVESGKLGGAAPAIFNAANEEAVGAFLAGKISFTSILSTVEKVISHFAKENSPMRDLADVGAVEQNARTMTIETLDRIAK
jgi:1-deoxy-D-xylulose-5-phosphate reductoisomerase